MKTMKLHVLMFSPVDGREAKVEFLLPMSDRAAERLLSAQWNGVTIREHSDLACMASAIGALNDMRGVFIRVEEVKA